MMSAAADEIFERLRDVEDESLRNQLGLTAHERECAIRYGHINESVMGIQKDFRRVATAGASIMLAVLAFLVKLVFFAS